MKLDWEDDYEVPDHIDLTKGNWIRNPYLQKFEDLNLISLDADVARVFRDSEAVNQALRVLIKAAKEAQPREMELPKAS